MLALDIVAASLIVIAHVVDVIAEVHSHMIPVNDSNAVDTPEVASAIAAAKSAREMLLTLPRTG